MELALIVRFHARREHEQAAAIALSEQVGLVRNEPGCVGRRHAFTRDAGVFFTHSRWSDEVTFDVHTGLTGTRRFMNVMEELIDHPIDVSRVRKIAWRAFRLPVRLYHMSPVVLRTLLEPDRVEDSESHRETKSQDPGKIPHRFSFLICRLRVLLDIGFAHRTAQYAVNPGGVGNHDGQKDHRDAQHNAKRKLAGRGVPHRQTRSRVA